MNFFSNCFFVAQKFQLYFLFFCFWSELKYFEITNINTLKKTLKRVVELIKNNMKRLLKQERASMCHGQCGVVLVTTLAANSLRGIAGSHVPLCL